MSKNASMLAEPLFVSPREYFSELISDALNSRKMEADLFVTNYLAEMMEFYMDVRNLYDSEDDRGRLKRETLAEMMLKAGSSDNSVKIETLKKLGDTSLYVSGFFGDSLHRKVVDIDYYADMGCTAYSTLAACVPEERFSRVFREFSEKFTMYVDVLAVISHKSLAQTNENILRLYEKYMKTGSELARDKLIELGVSLSDNQTKLAKQ